MLIATFGPTTAWAGKEITREGDFFILEDHGPLTADDVMEYDRQGHLVWANDGTRAWVGSKATQSALSTTPTADRGSPSAASPTPDRPRAPLLAALSQHLLLVIVVIVAAVAVVTILAVSGVFNGGASPGDSGPQPVAAQSATATAAASAAQTASWPTKLAGTWLNTSDTVRPPKIVIADSGGQAVITTVTASGTVLNWTFAGETLVGHTDAPNHVDSGPFGRTGPSSGPYTGAYVWTAYGFNGNPVVTMQVTFRSNTLTMAQTNSGGLSGLTQSEAYTLSADGKTLSVSWVHFLGSASAVYSRQ